MITNEQCIAARRATGSTAENLRILIELHALTDAYKSAAINALRTADLQQVAQDYKIVPATLYILQHNKKGSEA